MNEQYTQSDWERFNNMYKTAEDIALKYMRLFCSPRADLASIYFDEDLLQINTEEYYSGCGTEYGSHSIPLAWLSEPNLMDRCREQIEEDVIKEQERKKALAEKRKEEQRQEEYAKFLIYKEQFEPENK